jgi:hypothetical protein
VAFASEGALYALDLDEDMQPFLDEDGNTVVRRISQPIHDVCVGRSSGSPDDTKVVSGVVSDCSSRDSSYRQQIWIVPSDGDGTNVPEPSSTMRASHPSNFPH